MQGYMRGIYLRALNREYFKISGNSHRLLLSASPEYIPGDFQYIVNLVAGTFYYDFGSRSGRYSE